MIEADKQSHTEACNRMRPVRLVHFPRLPLHSDQILKILDSPRSRPLQSIDEKAIINFFVSISLSATIEYAAPLSITYPPTSL